VNRSATCLAPSTLLLTQK
jgi:hypothetical protein